MYSRVKFASVSLSNKTTAQQVAKAREKQRSMPRETSEKPESGKCTHTRYHHERARLCAPLTQPRRRKRKCPSDPERRRSRLTKSVELIAYGEK